MIINLINKILPPKGSDFFEFFDNSAKTCVESSLVLSSIMKNGLIDKNITSAKELKVISCDQTKQTLSFLNNTYMTSVDREDVQLINTNLNKTTKMIVRTILTLKNYQLIKFSGDLKKQIAILSEATSELQSAISNFRNFKKTDEIAETYERMKSIESKGDDVFYHAMSDLFSGKNDALTVIKLKDIYSNIEKVLDLCFYISELLVNVSLKHT